ncbi:MAG: hypothetical protein HOE61_02215 [Candidatus Marinimicrobia bacterium]|jgi:hypothetical protein|nr:hypothetical protein [Candidatus Neomarinimicrobiota bacterium]
MGKKKRTALKGNQHDCPAEYVHAPLSAEKIESIRLQCKFNGELAYSDPDEFRSEFMDKFRCYQIFSSHTEKESSFVELRGFFDELSGAAGHLVKLLDELNDSAMVRLTNAEFNLTAQLPTLKAQLGHLENKAIVVRDDLKGRGKGQQHPYSNRLYWLSRFMVELHIEITKKKPKVTWDEHHKKYTGSLVSLMEETILVANIPGASSITNISISKAIGKYRKEVKI